jgi:hypothetical protein
VPSRSFAEMRVEAVGEMPKRAGEAGVVTVDAAAGLAIKSFLAAMESDDSLFCLIEPIEGPSADGAAGRSVCSGDIVLEFRQAELKRQKSLHFLLIEKLIELLKDAGSQETLKATLSLVSGKQEQPNPKELVLWMRLDAKGDSPEQALLRWGLGLAHIQQALLFTSRHLRMHLAQAES